MKYLVLIIVVVNFLSCQLNKPTQTITVFAASSLQPVINELAEKYKASKGATVQVNYASSGILARQIANGASCDIYLSANGEWMSYLAARALIIDTTLCIPATNRLILIAADSLGDSAELIKLPQMINRHLALGDPNHVPAGIYARQALEASDIYSAIMDKVIPARDVCSALRLVEIGECDFGVVYSSNVYNHPKVKSVLTIPDSLHQAIEYHLALTADAQSKAVGFWTYIHDSVNKEVWNKYGST